MALRNIKRLAVKSGPEKAAEILHLWHLADVFIQSDLWKCFEVFINKDIKTRSQGHRLRMPSGENLVWRKYSKKSTEIFFFSF